ncbi:hypothetical protein ACXC9Q_33250 [Kribbella sp. CWNU-51]
MGANGEGEIQLPDDTSAPAAIELDAEGKQLQLQAEKARYLEAIAKAEQATAAAKTPSVASMLPTVTSAPKGEVTVGEKAGAIGAWRAHRMVDRIAELIAGQLEGELKLAKGTSVLVVDDRALLEGDWTARQVVSTLTRLHQRVSGLKEAIDSAKGDLGKGIDKYQQEESEREEAERRTVDEERPGDRGGWSREAETGAPTSGQPAAAGATPVGTNGVLGGAVDLLGLLRTDYALTAGNVASTPTELVTLAAGHLARAGYKVEADLFTTVPGSPSLAKYGEIVGARNRLVQALSKLQAKLAPVEAELTAINRRIALIEQEWAAAVADKEGKKTGEVLRPAGDLLALQAQRRERVAGLVRNQVADAVKNLAEVDASIEALVKAPQGGQSPLFTAARRERLLGAAGGRRPISHVLYVNLDSLSADTVTRRSILGASGIVRFLTAANASWLLLSTTTGTIVAGRQELCSDMLTLSLATGRATYANDPESLTQYSSQIRDPLLWFEWLCRAVVLALVIVLGVVGIVALLKALG